MNNQLLGVADLSRVLVVPFLREVDRLLVHFVVNNSRLLDTKGVRQKIVLSRLNFLGYTGLKLTRRRRNDDDSNIGL